MIKISKIKSQAKKRRRLRVRAKIFGTAKVPRLNVSRSLKHIFLQLIDDQKGKTLVSLHSKSLKAKGNKTEIAKLAGLAIARQAKDKKISQKYAYEFSLYEISLISLRPNEAKIKRTIKMAN